MKFVEAANNFTKFVGLANNLWKVRKTSKNFMKFVDWKVGFKCLKVFLYLSFTRLNILIGKHKCFVNTFHVSWILFTNKLMVIIYKCTRWDCWKLVFGRIKQVLVLYSVNTAKYYLGRLTIGFYGEVVVLQRYSLRQVWQWLVFFYVFLCGPLLLAIQCSSEVFFVFSNGTVLESLHLQSV